MATNAHPGAGGKIRPVHAPDRITHAGLSAAILDGGREQHHLPLQGAGEIVQVLRGIIHGPSAIDHPAGHGGCQRQRAEQREFDTWRQRGQSSDERHDQGRETNAKGL